MLLNCGVGKDSWVPWTPRRSNQPILKEISPEYSLEGPMLELKLQYFGHLTRRTDSLEKTLMLGKSEGRRRRGRQRRRWLMASPTRWAWVWASSRSWWWTGKPGMLQSMGLVRHDWATELDWDAGHWPPQCRGSLACTWCSGSFEFPLHIKYLQSAEERRQPKCINVSAHHPQATYTQAYKHGLGNLDHRPLWAAAPESTKATPCPPFSENYSRTFISSPNLPTLTKLYHFTCCTIYL